MLTIGLTGGIGSGKSTVTKLFSDLGTPFCDADDVARELTQAGSVSLEEITGKFGDNILTEDQQLDRKQLREIIFSNPEKRRLLESILHPRIAEKIHSWVENQNTPYAIVSIPLLAESNNDYSLDRILVIEVDRAIQRQRATQRDNSSATDIDAIIGSQASTNERRAIADDIINNNGDFESLRQQVLELHEKYLNESKLA